MPPPRGFRRSRALWEARRDESLWYYTSREFRNALLYELQPIRNIPTALQQCSKSLWRTARFLTVTLPVAVFQFLRSRSLHEWKIAGAVLLYYTFLRIVHAWLEAGPLVLISTLLVAIYTVGLSDNSNDGMLSAYAVFNKGFQKLMGSVDEEALLQQHVGGGMMGGGMMMMMNQRPQEQRNAREEEDIAQEEDQPQARRRRPRKKQGNHERNQQRREIQRQREAAIGMGFEGVNEEAAMNHLVEDALQ